MDLTLLLTTVGLVPAFVSRAFVPLFATALIARVGPEWEPVAGLLGVQLMAALPAAFTSDLALVVLGLGALLELAASKDPALRELVHAHDAELKGLFAVALCLLLAYADTTRGAAPGSAASLTASLLASGALGAAAYPWAFGIGALVWYVAKWRVHVYDFLRAIDEGDELGLQRLLSFVEDLLGPVGVLLVLVFPLLAACAAGVTLFGLWWVERALREAERRQLVPCSACRQPVLPCAPHCPACDVVRASPLKVGVLGLIRRQPSTEPAEHALLLTLRRRCAYCGTRLSGRGVRAACPTCLRPAFANRRSLQSYLSRLDRGVPLSLVILTLLSALPLLGVVFGVLYYRLTLVGSVRQYAPLLKGMLGRWTLRFVNLVLLGLQPIPLVGVVALPLMAMTNYWVFRRLVAEDGATLPD